MKRNRYCKLLKEYIADEKSGGNNYRKLAGMSSTATESRVIIGMARDEGRHKKTLKQIYNRRCK